MIFFLLRERASMGINDIIHGRTALWESLDCQHAVTNQSSCFLSFINSVRFNKILLSPVTLMHLHYCYYSALQVMMLQLPIASSKLPCSNALYNVKFAGDLNQIALRSLKALKGNFADARISFSIKARQQHWELRSLLVKKNYAMSSYLLFNSWIARMRKSEL